MPVTIGNQDRPLREPIAGTTVAIDMIELLSCAYDNEAKGNMHTAEVLRWAHEELRKRGVA